MTERRTCQQVRSKRRTCDSLAWAMRRRLSQALRTTGARAPKGTRAVAQPPQQDLGGGPVLAMAECTHRRRDRAQPGLGILKHADSLLDAASHGPDSEIGGEGRCSQAASLPCALAPAPRFSRPTVTAFRFGQATRAGKERELLQW